jgi:integrase
MASIYQDTKSGVYRILFRFGKPPRQFHKSLDTNDTKAAEAAKGRIESTLQAIEQGWLTIPPNADFWQFVFSGGKLDHKPSVADLLTLEKLFTRYEEEMPAGTMEANSLGTCKLHKKHLLRILGAKQAAQALATTNLQGYVNKRAKETYRGEPIKARTIQKEVATFRAVWNWGVLHNHLTGQAPVRGLKYDKGDEKPPFMTWAEIERRISRGGLEQKQIDALWDCLYLDPQQIAELLAYVKEHATHPFIYPMFVFVAHTGARRSEMIRSEVEDLDFATGQVYIREKKRDRSVKLTFRHVEMSPLCREVMEGWLKKGHPGGPYTFCHSDLVARSRKRSKTTGHKGEKTRASSLKERLASVRERAKRLAPQPLTRNEATYHFKETLAGGKWEKILGFHIFRHSLASNAAATDVRQEVIDGWLGHQTEDMRKRYRHLFPKEKQDALRRVFGG